MAILHAIAAQHESIAAQLSTLEDLTNTLQRYDDSLDSRKRQRHANSSRDCDEDDELMAIESGVLYGDTRGGPSSPPVLSALSKQRHCVHGRQKAHCRDCGGTIFCRHDKRKNLCTECGGSSMCIHGRRARECKSIECRQNSMCKHRMIRKNCVECGSPNE